MRYLKYFSLIAVIFSMNVLPIYSIGDTNNDNADRKTLLQIAIEEGPPEAILEVFRDHPAFKDHPYFIDHPNVTTASESEIDYIFRALRIPTTVAPGEKTILQIAVEEGPTEARETLIKALTDHYGIITEENSPCPF